MEKKVYLVSDDSVVDSELFPLKQRVFASKYKALDVFRELVDEVRDCEFYDEWKKSMGDNIDMWVDNNTEFEIWLNYEYCANHVHIEIKEKIVE